MSHTSGVWSTAVRIAGLHTLLSQVSAESIPDDDPRVAAMVEVLGAIAENHRDTPVTKRERFGQDFAPGETVMKYSSDQSAVCVHCGVLGDHQLQRLLRRWQLRAPQCLVDHNLYYQRKPSASCIR